MFLLVVHQRAYAARAGIEIGAEVGGTGHVFGNAAAARIEAIHLAAQALELGQVRSDVRQLALAGSPSLPSASRVAG